MNVLTPDQGHKQLGLFGSVLIVAEILLLAALGLTYLTHHHVSPALWVAAVVVGCAALMGLSDIRQYRKQLQQSVCPGDQETAAQYQMLRNHIVGAIRHATWKLEPEQHGDTSVYSIGEQLLVTAMPAGSSVAFECNLMVAGDRVLDPQTELPTGEEFCMVRRYAILADWRQPIQVKTEMLVSAGHDESELHEFAPSDVSHDWNDPAQHLMLLSDLEELLSYLRAQGM